ncbi:MAG TPA: T9SS type A sorting domain-containing protein, partial [Chitinophagaceae bacterium]|nr:T9SS type A sorting domain-containing protein [Chitinophagaceae bacterium]
LYKLGRFRFTNTVPWTAGSVASLTFQLNQTPGKTHAIAVGYVDTSSTNSALTVANTFLTADASDVASLTLNVPLPVTLTSFEGVHLGASDILRWTTSEEKNNARFHLQHSNNGIEFKTIATLASNALQGNSSMPLEYSFTYNEPVSGHNYYRLIQEDLDGQKKQSGSILDLYRNTDKQVSVYPQPCFNSCMLRIGQEQECTMQMFIYSIEGKRLLEEQIHLYPGTQEVNVPVNHIQPGTYLLVLQQGSGTWYTSTLIKQ